MVDSGVIGKVNREVYRKYPACVGKEPTISKQGETRFLFIYRAENKLSDGNVMRQTIRVVCTDSGDIVKMSASRG